ncbi:MAG: response regulator transcription factor [Burkholderiaceae bacterium]
MTEQIHLAVVDDEPDIRTLLGHYLGGRGFRVSLLASGAELMALMQADPPALILLDLGLQGEDGLSIARQVRARWQCGLVIVTGRGDAVDKIVGLEVGADDYVTKPFDLRELLARVNAVLRRGVVATRSAGGGGAASPEPSARPIASAAVPMTRGAPPAAFTAAGLADAACVAPMTMAINPAASPAPFGSPAGAAPAAERMVFADWVLDTGARTLTDPTGRDVPLTTGEFDLLGVLVRSAGRVLTRDYLLEQTRGRDARPFDRTIDVQVARLRKKLAPDPDSTPMIKSVRSVGYVFVPRVRVLP